jgi:hypothetical protein
MTPKLGSPYASRVLVIAATVLSALQSIACSPGPLDAITVRGGAGSAGASSVDGSAGSSGTAGAAGSGGAAGNAGTAGTGGTAGSSGSSGAGGVAGSDGGGTDGGGTTATCTSYEPDSTYPCVMSVPGNCGSNPNSCSGFTCPPNSTCGTGNNCNCVSGYLPVDCSTGLRCLPNDKCPGGTWGCVVRPDPGCTGNPSETRGACNCSDGKTHILNCGGTITCDQRCRQG